MFSKQLNEECQLKFSNILSISLLFLFTGCSTLPPVQNALKNGNTKKAEQLILNGNNVNDRDEVGSTALHYAAYYNNLTIAKLLLDKGFDIDAVNSYNSTPLREAARGLNSEMVRFLITSGADINKKNHGGQTMLCAATIENNPEFFQEQLLTVSALIELGAPIYTNKGDENNASLNRWMGEYYESKSDFGKALESFNIALHSYEKDYQHYNERSESYAKRANRKESEARSYGQSTTGIIGSGNRIASMMIDGQDSITMLNLHATECRNEALAISKMIEYCKKKISNLEVTRP